MYKNICEHTCFPYLTRLEILFSKHLISGISALLAADQQANLCSICVYLPLPDLPYEIDLFVRVAARGRATYLSA